MIAVILFIVVLGITLVAGLVVFADAIEPVVMPRIERLTRRIKRELLARWLTEYGLTVRPITETETALQPVRTVSVEELVELINDF